MFLYAFARGLIGCSVTEMIARHCTASFNKVETPLRCACQANRVGESRGSCSWMKQSLLNTRVLRKTCFVPLNLVFEWKVLLGSFYYSNIDERGYSAFRSLFKYIYLHTHDVILKYILIQMVLQFADE